MREPLLFLRVISRLYLTYFILDARSVLRSLMTGRPHRDYTAEDVLGYQAHALRRKNFRSARAVQIQEKFQTREWNDVIYYIDMLLAITRTWQDLVEQHGGQFHIVLLPREEENVAEDLFRGTFSVINLYGLFSDMVPGYDYEMIRFREDPHWDETGNMLAAIALYREISPLRGRTPADALTVAARLRTYYSSFDGWYPADLPPGCRSRPSCRSSGIAIWGWRANRGFASINRVRRRTNPGAAPPRRGGGRGSVDGLTSCALERSIDRLPPFADIPCN